LEPRGIVGRLRDSIAQPFFQNTVSTRDTMFADCYDDFLSAAYLAGARPEFKLRLIWDAARAIDLGDDWRDTLDSLTRNRPEFFSEKEALRRQRKARLQTAGY